MRKANRRLISGFCFFLAGAAFAQSQGRSSLQQEVCPSGASTSECFSNLKQLFDRSQGQRMTRKDFIRFNLGVCYSTENMQPKSSKNTALAAYLSYFAQDSEKQSVLFNTSVRDFYQTAKNENPKEFQKTVRKATQSRKQIQDDDGSFIDEGFGNKILFNADSTLAELTYKPLYRDPSRDPKIYRPLEMERVVSIKKLKDALILSVKIQAWDHPGPTLVCILDRTLK